MFYLQCKTPALVVLASDIERAALLVFSLVRFDRMVQLEEFQLFAQGVPRPTIFLQVPIIHFD